MKIQQTVSVLALAAGVTISTLAAQSISPNEVRFREARHKEQVEGDLNGAIKIYQVLASAKGDRNLSAKALLQLGVCYEKQGSAEARKAYEKVLLSFGDQDDATRVARMRLARLTGKPGVATDMTARRLSRPISPFTGQVRTVSRDGAYTAYIYDRRSIPVLVDLKTGSERDLGARKTPLIASGELSSTAAISPDGSLVAYNRVRDDWTSEIHIIGVNSAEPKVLYRGPAAVHILDWSRDGSALLVREVRTAAQQPLRWLLINARTGEARELNLPAGRFGTDLFTEAEQLQVQAGLSPDARFVAYTQLNERSEPSVYVAPVDGSAHRRVTVPGASAYVFAWSPNGRSLLYISDQSGAHDLWALDIKDGSPVGLPTLVKKDIGPVLGTGIADDGSVFYSVKVNTGSVYVGELDVEAATVHDMRELPQPRGARNASAKWSPDGLKLLLLRRETADSTFQNAIYDVLTGQEHEIAIPDNLVRNKDTAGGAERSYEVDWTPDPRTMLFASARLKGPTQISIVDTVTGEVKRRTNASDTAAAYYKVTQSPDGHHVFAVTGRNMSNDSRVVRINIETGQENNVCRARPMVWAVSPDGKYVACGGYGDSIQVVAEDGSGARDIVKGGMFSAMAWTPDGKNLIYTTVERGALTSAKYWIVPFGGGEPRRLTVPLDRLGMLSIHPSGRRIAITATGKWTELWVLQNLNTSQSRPTP